MSNVLQSCGTLMYADVLSKTFKHESATFNRHLVQVDRYKCTQKAACIPWLLCWATLKTELINGVRFNWDGWREKQITLLPCHLGSQSLQLYFSLILKIPGPAQYHWLNTVCSPALCLQTAGQKHQATLRCLNTFWHLYKASVLDAAVPGSFH